MDQTVDRLLNSPESALSLIGGNDIQNLDGYSIANSLNGSPHTPTSGVSQQSVNQPHENLNKQNREIGELLHDLMQSLHQSQQLIDTDSDNFSREVQKHTYSLITHRLMPSLYSVFSEHKQKTGLSTRSSLLNQANDDQADPQVQRLDNMLIAEGVTAPPEGYIGPRPHGQLDNAIEHCDYRDKLARIKEWYHRELGSMDELSKTFTNHVMSLLHNQSNARPILPEEAQLRVKIIEKKLNSIKIHLKQLVCESVMNLRSRFLDARRKRRNFSKQASEILNNYFYSHLSNPYPSEEAKEELAKKCDITVAQVSNWFGNKRIRYKKNIGKAQEEANMYAAKKAVASVAGGAGRSSPYPVVSSRSHATPTPPMMSPAPSVSSQGEIPAAYGMNLSLYHGNSYAGPTGYHQMNLQRSSPDSQ